MAKSAALQREPREKARRIKARIPRRLLNSERRSFLAPFGEKKRLLQVAEEHHFLKPEKWLLCCRIWGLRMAKMRVKESKVQMRPSRNA